MAQVQGSASVELPDGRLVRLAYDGRNGQPYTSIGRLLIESGEIAEAEMSLARLKSWLRANGLAPGGKARALMQRNRSYVFFKLETAFDPADGPIGGAGVGLTTVALDRRRPRNLGLWDAVLARRAICRGGARSQSAFRRLTIAQDTGSAIFGAARADLYFGGGDEAGTPRRRHPPCLRFHRAPARGRAAVKEPPVPRPARLRRLSDEEIDLWIAVAKSVSRRKGAKLPSPRKVEPPPVAAARCGAGA